MVLVNGYFFSSFDVRDLIDVLQRGLPTSRLGENSFKPFIELLAIHQERLSPFNPPNGTTT